jgi:hypothetical protein
MRLLSAASGGVVPIHIGVLPGLECVIALDERGRVGSRADSGRTLRLGPLTGQSP